MSSPLDRVQQSVDVTELVVEQRTDDAGRQIEAYVAELLASLVPRLELVGLRCSAAHRECHAAVPLPGVRDDLLEVIDLLELLFDPVQHLVLDLPRRGTGPDDERGHRRDREVRVFELAELDEAEGPAYGDREEQEEHEGAVAERPLGEIERFHGVLRLARASLAAPGSATRNPGAIFCTPAVTTSVPAGGPDTKTLSLRYP